MGSVGEGDEIAVGIGDDEGSPTPGLGPQDLMKDQALRLILQEQGLDAIEDDRRREQILPRPPAAIEYRTIDMAEIEARAVADHLAVEGRIAIKELHPKAELAGVERARPLDIGGEELRLGESEEGFPRLEGG